MAVLSFTKTTNKVKARGAHGGIDYLTGSRGRKARPEVLRGNPTITKSLLDHEKGSNAYTTAVLSFEENALDISQEAQDYCMNLLEETIMAGFPSDHYHIDWIRHTDKDFNPDRKCGRLELNLHIVNRDLKTGKVITPYLHKLDLERVDLAKQIINDKFNFTSPDDPLRARMMVFEGFGVELKGKAKSLHDYIRNQFDGENIDCRDDVLEMLRQHPDIEHVPDKQPKNYVVVKPKGAKRNLRLKGTIYDGEKFSSFERLVENQEEQHRIYVRDRERRVETNIKRLRELNRKKAESRSDIIRDKRKRGRKSKKESEPITEGIAQRTKEPESTTPPRAAEAHQGNDRTEPSSSRTNRNEQPTLGRPITEAQPNGASLPLSDQYGFSPRWNNDVLFSTLDFEASLQTKRVGGRNLTRAQRQWYSVYRTNIDQRIVGDTIITKEHGSQAKNTLASKRLDAVIREYDNSFTVSPSQDTDKAKQAFVVTIEACVAKGWKLDNIVLKPTDSGRQPTEKEQQLLREAMLEYCRIKGIEPPNKFKQDEQNRERISNDVEASQLREGTKQEKRTTGQGDQGVQGRSRKISDRCSEIRKDAGITLNRTEKSRETAERTDAQRSKNRASSEGALRELQADTTMGGAIDRRFREREGVPSDYCPEYRRMHESISRTKSDLERKIIREKAFGRPSRPKLTPW